VKRLATQAAGALFTSLLLLSTADVTAAALRTDSLVVVPDTLMAVPDTLIMLSDTLAFRQDNTDASPLLSDSIYMNIQRHGFLSLGYFSYFQNSSSILTSVERNAEQIRDFDHFFNVLLKDTLIHFERAELTGSTSPEGPRWFNATLARARARSLGAYLDEHYRLSSRMPILFHYIEEDWDGLQEKVEATTAEQFPERDEVLHILSRKQLSNDRRMEQLRRLNAGKAYRYLMEHIFPTQRRAIINMVCNLSEQLGERADSVLAYRLLPQAAAEQFVRDTTIASIPVVLPTFEQLIDHHALDTLLTRVVQRIDTVRVTVRDTVTIVKQVPQVITQTPLVVALKSNLLFDLALLPNLAVEVAFPGQWSTEVEMEYAWWNTEKRYTYRLFTAGLELRKWLGNADKPALHGHFLGIYAKAGIYDIMFRTARGYQSNGISVSTGISYGYSTRLSRRLNLELGLSAGYVGGKYDKYHYDAANHRYPWDATFRLNYFGLTKAKIGLVYTFGKSNNKR
jgi:hypothetical protein